MADKDLIVNLEDLKVVGDAVGNLKSAITEQTYNLLSGVIPNSMVDSNGKIMVNAATTDYATAYAPIEANQDYTVTTNDSLFVYGFTSSVPAIGSTLYDGRHVVSGSGRTFTASISGYIVWRIIGADYNALIVEGDTIRPYIQPVTAIDAVARNSITSSVAALKAESLTPKETPSGLTQLSTLQEMGIYAIGSNIVPNLTDKPSGAVSGQVVTLVVYTGFYASQAFIVQDWHELSNRIFRRLIQSGTGTVFVAWTEIMTAGGLPDYSLIYTARNIGSERTLTNLVVAGTYHIDSGVFDALTDAPSDAAHGIYNLFVDPKAWNGQFTIQRFQAYDGRVWQRTFNTSTKAILSDWERIDAVYSIQQHGGNVLWGKKLVTAGDSYTEAAFSGDYASYNKKNYGYYIAQRNNMTFVNSGISGSTMAIPSVASAGNRSPFSVQRYLDVPADTDYLTIWFGINDSAYSTLGTINDTENTTFYGAWNKVLEYYLTNRPFMKVLIIVTTIGVGDTTNAENFKQAIRDVAEKWGYPIMDWNNDKSIPAFFEKTGMSSAAKALRKNAYGWDGPVEGHPNPAWHEYESSIIEARLRMI